MQIPSNGGTLWAQERGEGDPVVFISGMNQDHQAWVMQEPLADDFRMVLVDNRGTGESSDWLVDDENDPPTTGDMAEDIIAVLDGLGIERAHVVGFSMGGRIAQWVAARWPKRVGALVLIGTSPGDRHGVPRDAEADRLLEGTPLEQSMLMYSSGWMTKHTEQLRTIYSSTSTRSTQRHLQYLAAHGHDSFNSLPRIAAPTLIVHGVDDRINPVENAAILAAHIQNAEQLIIPGGRHAVMAEFSDTVNTGIREFLQAHPLA